ncbi:hypothetical protein [Escherichia coli]|uniref:hypothetical protein n=1 Tax=Escherichia coli TaxID=562 RepID=UPI000CFB12B1|nr:hypothetical protein [Escherichia coli]MBE8542919.1 hypothetical protein [Escherichia coli]MBE8560882.1 hypothetical protein [Escherichia coli]HDS8835162.1 hypothetical protein [Escherichia coli]
MSNDRGSSSGENQKTEQCIQEFQVTNQFKKMMKESLEEQKKVIDKRVKTLTHWSDEAEDEFRRIFGVPSEKIITIKFKLNGEVTKETKSARAVIQEAVDRMKFICDKLSADKGECKEVTFIDKYLDSNDNYYDKDVTKWKCGNFVNSTDNDAYTANVTPDHIIGVSPDKYVDVVTIRIGQRFVCKPMTGKDSKVSSLCHELTHLVRYGPNGMYGGMQSEDMPVDKELQNAKEYDIFADKLIKNKDIILFENAYNIERYFEID